MKVWLGILALLVALVAAGTMASHAYTACAGYSATAPVVGTRSGTACAPIQLPPNFSNPFGGGSCPEVPPAGVAACASARVYLP